MAFLKNNASISQTVYLDAGVYNLSFLAAQRVNYQTQNQGIEVLIDGADVGMIVPDSPVAVNNTTSTTSYAPYQTSNFTVTAGTHTVEFLGMSPSTADSTAFIDEVAITPVVDALVDGGFEQPALAANTFQTDPSGSAWQFSGTAGMARNGSDFATNWIEAQNAPAGTQVGYLQDNGSMSQTVYLDAGTYQLSFLAAQRAIYQTQLSGNRGPGRWRCRTAPINPVNTLYGSYQSSTFTVAAGVAHHRVPRLGSPGRRQHGLHRSGDPLGQRHQRRQLRDAGLERRGIPVAPTGSPWQFSATAGMARNGSSFTSGNPNAPDGSQVAFIQGNGSMSQSVDLVAGAYNISFQAAQRANGQTQDQQIEVLVDGARKSA